MNALESEFLENQATPYDEFPAYFDEDDKPMHIDHIWHQIFKQIDLYSCQPHFKHLASKFNTSERSALIVEIT